MRVYGRVRVGTPSIDGSPRAIMRAARKAAATSLREMRSESSKRVRKRKRLKAKKVRAALVPRRNKGRSLEAMAWGVDVRGDVTRLGDYPHRQLRKGVRVEVNRGQRTVVASAFVATMPSGHRGVFLRRGARRLPVAEPLASRAVDALLHTGEAEGVSTRGRGAFVATFDRVLPLEIAKERK